jgi:hypothetical protein
LLILGPDKYCTVYGFCPELELNKNYAAPQTGITFNNLTGSLLYLSNVFALFQGI